MACPAKASRPTASAGSSEVIGTNPGFLRDFLLDGELAREGLVFRDKLEPILAGRRRVLRRDVAHEAAWTWPRGGRRPGQVGADRVSADILPLRSAPGQILPLMHAVLPKSSSVAKS